MTLPQRAGHSGAPSPASRRPPRRGPSGRSARRRCRTAPGPAAGAGTARAPAGRRDRRRNRADGPRAAACPTPRRRSGAGRARSRPGARCRPRRDRCPAYTPSAGQADALGHRDVGGREPELAAALVAVLDAAAHLVRPAEDRGRALDVAAREQRARLRRRVRNAAVGRVFRLRRRDEPVAEHLEAELGAHALAAAGRRRGGGSRSGSRRRPRRAARRARRRAPRSRSLRRAPCCAPRRTGARGTRRPRRSPRAARASGRAS